MIASSNDYDCLQQSNKIVIPINIPRCAFGLRYALSQNTRSHKWYEIEERDLTDRSHPFDARGKIQAPS